MHDEIGYGKEDRRNLIDINTQIARTTSWIVKYLHYMFRFLVNKYNPEYGFLLSFSPCVGI